MPPDKSHIVARAAAAAVAGGQDWNRLLDAASEVAVFGSTAAGMDGPFSDVDLWVVGPVEPRRKRELDLIVRTPNEVWTPQWLGSELASHIAAYGLWIKGHPLWPGEARLNERARDRKLARIQRLLAATQRYWPRLDQDFRRQSLITIRRELQRASLLQIGIAIPPTPELDRRAASETGNLSVWIHELQAVNVRDEDAGFLAHVADTLPQPSMAHQRS